MGDHLQEFEPDELRIMDHKMTDRSLSPSRFSNNHLQYALITFCLLVFVLVCVTVAKQNSTLSELHELRDTVVGIRKTLTDETRFLGELFDSICEVDAGF